RTEFELARVEIQIREFWGPLDTLTQQVLTVHRNSKAMITDLEALGRVAPKDTIPRDALDLSDPSVVQAAVEDPRHRATYFVWRTFFVPLHIEIQQVIKEHRDLIDASLPESFQTYLQHSIGEQMRYGLRETSDGVETLGVSEVRWPHAFVEDIQAGLRAAREEQKALLEQLKRG
ncbi:MAG: hypothetical protein AAGF44_12860, partial [Pseudomonadota bacterium]